MGIWNIQGFALMRELLFYFIKILIKFLIYYHQQNDFKNILLTS